MSPSPSAQYSITLRVEIAHTRGMLGRVAGAIGDAGGVIGAIDLVEVHERSLVRDVTVDAASSEEWNAIRRSVDAIEGATVVDATDRTFLVHVGRKIEQRNRIPLKTRDDLSMAYTPGVARVCEAIARDPDKAFQYTIKRNTVAVVSDGTAVLGMGDIGPRAAMPVMEGKAMLFKEFAGVDAFPVCLDTKDPEEIIDTVARIAPGFRGINLEDISAPRCFEIETRLKERLDIPVFHDDQHGTAIVVLAALLNAVKLVDKRLEDLRVLVVGLGAVGRGRDPDPARGRRARCHRLRLARRPAHRPRGLRRRLDARRQARLRRADQPGGPRGPSGRGHRRHPSLHRPVGRAHPGPEALGSMARDPMVFAMANPVPEISPEEAAPYARIMATGRSDYPNQINNVLAFPGVFRGALDVRAPAITEEMKIAAARAIAEVVGPDELREDYVIPPVFNRDVAEAVAGAVAGEARRAGDDRGGDTIGFAAIDAERLHAQG